MPAGAKVHGEAKAAEFLCSAEYEDGVAGDTRGTVRPKRKMRKNVRASRGVFKKKAFTRRRSVRAVALSLPETDCLDRPKEMRAF